MPAEKPTLAQFDEAVGLLHETLDTLDFASIGGLKQVIQSDARSLLRKYDPDTVTLGYYTGEVRFTTGQIDKSKDGKHHKYNAFIHGSIPAEEECELEATVLTRSGVMPGHVVAVPVANNLLGTGEGLAEQRVRAALVTPMPLSTYLFEQAQRRQAGLPMLDTDEVTRFPQIVLPPSYGDISSPRGSWDQKLVIDRSDARAYEHAGFREIYL